MTTAPPDPVLDPAVIDDLLRDSLAKGLRPRLVIVSGSMRPLLAVGDQVELEACAAAQLRPGDIAVLRAGGLLFTHRYRGELWRDGRRYLITRGDRPLAYDAPWPEEDLMGRAARRLRRGRALDLRSGPGDQLNRLLARAASWEERLFGGPGPADWDWERLSEPMGRQLALRWRRSSLGRRALYGVRAAIFLAYHLPTIALGRQLP